MSKKLTNNGLWESSRMMLPEHKIRIQESNVELNKVERPQLDVQKWEEINKMLSDSLAYNQMVNITLFGEYSNRVVAGFVSKIDGSRRRIQISGEWLRVKDIIDVVCV